MGNFDERFKRQRDEFDKNFANAQKLAIGWFVFVAVLTVATLAFCGFIILKLLQHFGVL